MALDIAAGGGSVKANGLSAMPSEPMSEARLAEIEDCACCERSVCCDNLPALAAEVRRLRAENIELERHWEAHCCI